MKLFAVMPILEASVSIRPTCTSSEPAPKYTLYMKAARAGANMFIAMPYTICSAQRVMVA